MPKILLVDDEPDILQLIALRLRTAGYEVITGRDGQEAITLVRQHQPDLVILDVMMPKLNGFQVARMIKFDKKLKDIPVFLLTARTQPSDKTTGAQVGADEYITKPFDVKVLVERINTWLARKSGTGAVGTPPPTVPPAPPA